MLLQSTDCSHDRETSFTCQRITFGLSLCLTERLSFAVLFCELSTTIFCEPEDFKR